MSSGATPAGRSSRRSDLIGVGVHRLDAGIERRAGAGAHAQRDVPSMQWSAVATRSPLSASTPPQRDGRTSDAGRAAARGGRRAAPAAGSRRRRAGSRTPAGPRGASARSRHARPLREPARDAGRGPPAQLGVQAEALERLAQRARGLGQRVGAEEVAHLARVPRRPERRRRLDEARQHERRDALAQRGPSPSQERHASSRPAGLPKQPHQEERDVLGRDLGREQRVQRALDLAARAGSDARLSRKRRCSCGVRAAVATSR